MDVKKRAEIIIEWINNYCDSASSKPEALIIGISGGVEFLLLVLYVQILVEKLLC